MRAPADDEPTPEFGAPDAGRRGTGPGERMLRRDRDRDRDRARGGDGEPEDRYSEGVDDATALERDRWAMRASAHPGRRSRRRAASLTLDPDEHHDPDRRRYFLSSIQPSGDYEAVIVAITDGARRRYFSSRDGSHFIEVDELSFEQRRKSGSRSMLEIGEHELRELEGALIFVRPLDGRDPIAEVAAAKRASLEATRPMAIVPVGAPAAAAGAEAADRGPADETVSDETTDGAADAERDSGSVVADAASAVDGGASEAEALEPSGRRRSTFEPVPQPAEPVVPSEASEPGAPSADHPIGSVVSAPAHVEVDPSAPAAAEPSAPTEPRPAPPVASAPRRGPLTDLEAVAQVALAKGIAFAAHRGQLDKSGTPYIDHPGRIAERFDPVADPIAAAAAWLHDVLEDTPLTSRELFEAGILLEIVGVVELLTRRPEVTPDEYYARIRRHPVALRVKLADIDDNTAPWRLRRLDFAKQQRLAEKYRHARRALGVE
ncbi:hypothetical protein [Agromyces sp. GXS1127]|uniref:hypothetical protein n=1 Tax=Agromyces sp. GXS1127 TaxID=3424181 RepID=UPI003D31A332